MRFDLANTIGLRKTTLALTFFICLFVLSSHAHAQTEAQAQPPALEAAQVKAPEAQENEGKLPFVVRQEQKLHNHSGYPGDRINFDVEFSSEKPFSAEVWGDLALDKFELDERDVKRGEKEGRNFVRFTFSLLTFEVGKLELPQITFRLKDAKGKTEERKSEVTRVEIKSVLMEEVEKQARRQAAQKGVDKPQDPAGAKPRVVTPGSNDPVGPTIKAPGPQGAPGVVTQQQPGQQPPLANGGQQQPQGIKVEPRDIKGVVPLVEQDYTVAYILGALLALILLALIVWLILRRRKPAEEEAELEFVDTRPAHVVAYERIKQLEEKNLIALRKLKDFHLELSDILRDYLERRFDFQATAMSTEEVLLVLEHLYMKGLDERLVYRILSSCDLVKFAKFVPDDKSSLELLSEVRSVIERTKQEEGVTDGIR